MKYLLTLTLLFNIAFAQIESPVHWNYTAVHKSGNIWELHFHAMIDDGWHIYSHDQPAEAISVPTDVTFKANPVLKFLGKSTEKGNRERYEDQNAGIIQYQYAGTLDIYREVQLKVSTSTVVSGTITYQACTNQQCLPPKTIPFEIKLGKS